MALTVEAVYENGVLKPAQPLPLKEHEQVQITVHSRVSKLADLGVNVPDGFATTAEAYRRFIGDTGLAEEISEKLKGLDTDDTRQLAETLTGTTRILTMLLGAVAAVSLVVGGIGTGHSQPFSTRAAAAAVCLHARHRPNPLQSRGRSPARPQSSSSPPKASA